MRIGLGEADLAEEARELEFEQIFIARSAAGLAGGCRARWVARAKRGGRLDLIEVGAPP